MDQEKLQRILEKHQLWLQTRHLHHIKGCRADLRYANLTGANLTGIDLRYANLMCADLRYANLTNADLRYANLTNADLGYTNLTGANLGYTNLTNADLIYADLNNVNLINVNLKGTKNVPFIPFTCPDSGSFIGYKKANDYVVKLKILEDARRCSATGRKCRCDKAQVLSITNLDGTDANIASVSSNYDKSFIYTVGEVVEVSDFDTNRWNDCSAGIHFFINRQEAVEYYY